MQDGVRILRVPVAFRLSKGVIMPSFGWRANKLVREMMPFDSHLPQFEILRHLHGEKSTKNPPSSPIIAILPQVVPNWPTWR